MKTIGYGLMAVGLAAAWVLLFLAVSAGAAAADAAPGWLEGRLEILYGDGAQPFGGQATRYFLQTASGENYSLALGAALQAEPGQLTPLNRQQVRVLGSWLPRAGREERTFRAEAVSLAADALPAPEDVSGPQPWISILCKFNDVAAEPRDLDYFLNMFSSEYPGLDHYWREQSYDRINMNGSGAVGWFTLPRNRSEYLSGGSLNWGLAAQDCTGVANASVNFAGFVGINLMFNDELDGYAWGGEWYLCLDGICQNWRMTWEPPWGYGNIGVIAHENGHGFGLPHSSGNYGQTYDNRWDVMSDVWGNCDSGGAQHPVYGCVGQHTIGYHKDSLGWIGEGLEYTAGVGARRTITIEQLALPPEGNFRLATIPINGLPNFFYTVEARRLAGYDSYLPGNAIVIHQVYLSRERPAYVIDADGNGNTGDAGAMWLPGEMFSDAANDIRVRVEAATSSGFVVTIENRPMAPLSVAILGPHSAVVQTPAVFTAAILPVNATPPFTYRWEASGQSPVTHTAGISDSVAFTWQTPGIYTVTVYAANDLGSVSDAHVLAVNGQAPQSVVLEGPGQGAVGAAIPFSAAVFPITSTQPLTYTWQFSGLPDVIHTAGVTDAVQIAWDAPGAHAITVTAANAYGQASASAALELFVAPGAVSLSGPQQGWASASYAFTAAVAPVSTTLPVTYHWQADGLSPLMHSGGLSDTVMLGWDTPGERTITVTVENPGGAAVSPFVFSVLAVAPGTILLDGPASGEVGAGSLFTATATPVSATLPLEFVWVLQGPAGSAPITHTAGLSDTLAVEWLAPGSYTLTVTAANSGGWASASLDIVVYRKVYLPAIFR